MVTEITVTGKPIHTAAVEDRWADFTDYLEISGRTLSGTPTVTEYTLDSAGAATSSSDWTISGVAVNSSAITLNNGNTIAANKAVVFRLTDAGTATSGTTYRFRISAASSSSETLVGNIDILCSNS